MGCSKITILLLGVYIQGASLVAQTVKNLPGMQETWVQSLGQEDPLEKEMATPGEGNGNPLRRKWQFFAWKIFLPGKFHGQRSLAGYSPWGHKELANSKFKSV